MSFDSTNASALLELPETDDLPTFAEPAVIDEGSDDEPPVLAPLSLSFAASTLLPIPHAEADFIPTPEEIAQACAEIQAGWSEKDKRSRRRLMPEEVDKLEPRRPEVLAQPKYEYDPWID